MIRDFPGWLGPFFWTSGSLVSESMAFINWSEIRSVVCFTTLNMSVNTPLVNFEAFTCLKKGGC